MSNEDIHMQGSLDATNSEQPYVDTLISLAAGNTLLVDIYGLYNFTDTCLEHVSIVTSLDGAGTTGVDLTVE